MRLLGLTALLQLALLLLAATHISAETCLEAEAKRGNGPFPIVRQRSVRYKTILSLDGGDFRATIYASVLCHVEMCIKKALVAKGLTKYMDPNEFDIVLSDYVDLVAGSSAGTYISTYITTQGANVAAIIPGHTATPGSPLGMYQFMVGLGNLFNVTLQALPATDRANYTVTGPALYTAFDVFFKGIYGERSLRSFKDVKVPAVWAWTSANLYGPTSNGASGLTPYSDPVAKKAGLLVPLTNGTEENHMGTNFYLWQTIRGSTSWPARVPALIAPTTPDSTDNATYTIMDGAILAMDPSTIGLSYMLKHRNVGLRKLAVLSLGSGLVHNEVNSAGGNWLGLSVNYNVAWGASLGNRVRSVDLMTALFPKPANGPSQYLRLDVDLSQTGPTGCGRLNVTEEMCKTFQAAAAQAIINTNYANIPTYALLGDYIGLAYTTYIDAFVNKFMIK